MGPAPSGAADPIGDALRAVLLGQWLMDAASGAPEPDTSPNAYDLTATNSPGSDTGLIGTSRTFVAASSQTLSRTQAQFNVTEGCYSLWIYDATNFGGNYAQFAGLTSTLATGSTFLGLDTTGQLGWYDWGGGANRFTAGYTPSAAWRWLCWNFTSGGNATLYLDNVEFLTAAMTYVNGHNTFSLGGVAGIGYYMGGRLDLAAVFSARLDADQRSYMYNGGAGRVLSS